MWELRSGSQRSSVGLRLRAQLLPALARGETMNVSAYAQRRAKLAQQMGHGVAIIPTAPERVRNRDSHYPYRFASYSYYLTGVREPEGVLVMLAGSAAKSILFCRERDPEREVWDGFRYGPEAAREACGFDEAYPIAQLDAKIPGLLADCRVVYCHLGGD